MWQEGQVGECEGVWVLCSYSFEREKRQRTSTDGCWAKNYSIKMDGVFFFWSVFSFDSVAQINGTKLD